MGGAQEHDTKTQDHDGGALPAAIRWLSPEATPTLPLGLADVTIGRGRRNTVPIADDFLSEQHVRIEHVDGAFVLRDLDSKNGTFLNGLRTRRGILRVGDVLRMGEAVGLLVARVPEVKLSAAGTADLEQRLACFQRLWGASPSEARTLGRVVLGVANKNIASDNRLSISTVELHMSTLFRAAGVGNRAELVAKFWSTPLPDHAAP